jgi:hypothetical protein
MKKFLKTTSTVILSIFVLEVLLSLVAYTPEHEYKLTEQQAIAVFNHEQLLKQLLPQSDLPAKQVTTISPSIDSILNTIATQYKNFNDTTKNK